VGLAFWPLVPRLAPVLTLAFVFALLLPTLNRGRGRKGAYTLAGVLLLVIAAGGAAMFWPHSVVRNTLASAPPVAVAEETAIDILPLLKQVDSYRVQRSVVALLNHLGGFLLLIPYFRIHFTGEPGMSCP